MRRFTTAAFTKTVKKLCGKDPSADKIIRMTLAVWEAIKGEETLTPLRDATIGAYLSDDVPTRELDLAVIDLCTPPKRRKVKKHADS